MIGEALAPLQRAGKVVIVTKFGMKLGASDIDSRPEHIRELADPSLRLKVSPALREFVDTAREGAGQPKRRTAAAENTKAAMLPAINPPFESRWSHERCHDGDA